MTSRRDEDRAIYDLLALAFEVDPDETELEATDALADVLVRASRLVAGFVHEEDAPAAPARGARRGQQELWRLGALASHAPANVRPDRPDMRGIRAGGWRRGDLPLGAAPLEVANDTAHAWDRPGSPIVAPPTRHLKWALVAILCRSGEARRRRRLHHAVDSDEGAAGHQVRILGCFGH